MGRSARVKLWASLLVLLCAATTNAATLAPDEATATRILWGTMVAVDHANRTGNYSVLQALAARDFQRQNNLQQLAENFSTLRAGRVDVGRAISMTPTYFLPPHITEAGLLRLRGAFESRPAALRFDLLYLYEDGGWRLYGISIQEVAADQVRQ